ncbi:PQQ-dependent sugar dehydrogenase [Candidatus Acetothermia bacterium]|nr:PQQ-dependent sugar dehydrogenase [Candidatus Acetothermia bacterium]
MTRAQIGAIATVILLVCSGFSYAQEMSSWPQIFLTKRFTGFSQPVFVTHPGDQSGRLFVVEQGGTIRLIKNGNLLSTPFLNITDKVLSGSERGLLSVAFPPSYSSKKHFYVYYTDQNGDLIISRFGLTANPDVANPNSEEILLTINHRANSNHNGGQLAFSPNDGFLYIGTGDGGGGGDPDGNGQNADSLLGKILRIDVESGVNPYAIPASNPFVGRMGYRSEIWALGVRNPWRYAFDHQTGDLYIGDVGQNSFEEIDVQSASSTGGENYGWNIMEGLHCFNTNTCNQAGLTLPVAEYDHSDGDCAVTGGRVYRGQAFPTFSGIYFFADFCTGKIFGLRKNGTTWEQTMLRDSPYNISTFGEDEDGNLYVVDYSAGNIYLITDTPSCDNVTATSSPRSVTYRPTATRASRRIIFLTITNRTGDPIQIQGITPQTSEFTILSISPALGSGVQIKNGRRRTFTVRTERAAGLSVLRVNTPYFKVETSCGQLVTASKPFAFVPWSTSPRRVSITSELIKPPKEAALVRTSLFDLSGRQIAEHTAETIATPSEIVQGKELPPGMYLYVVTIQMWDGKVYLNQITKIVWRR